MWMFSLIQTHNMIKVRVCGSDVILSAHWRGVHVHQRPGAVSVDQAEVRDSRRDAVHFGGEEDAAGPHGPLHQVLATARLHQVLQLVCMCL